LLCHGLAYRAGVGPLEPDPGATKDIDRPLAVRILLERHKVGLMLDQPLGDMDALGLTLVEERVGQGLLNARSLIRPSSQNDRPPSRL
jgi:hypothetical protein